MRFSRKIFISVFLTTLTVGSLLTWATYRYATDRQTSSFIKQYTTTSQLLGRTLSRLDTHTEALMMNAAKVVAAKDSEKGLLSTQELKEMREELSVTHIFVVDKKGNFIRSTNEDPKLIPNAFSFCPSYVNLINGSDNVAATPLIHPRPEPKPYKFLFIPSKNRDRLIEVGVRIDFVAKTLTEALGSDPSILTMSLYTPNGVPFGKFSANEVEFNGPQAKLPDSLPYFVDTGKEYRFFEKVTSSHPSCCQCDVSGTSRNGEYYYVLESVVSKKDLTVVQAATRNVFFLLALGGVLIALVFSRCISRRLVRNIEKAAKRIHEIKMGDPGDRIHLKGPDEVAYITQEFDRMLDSMQDSQRKVIEAELAHAKVQMAKEVAHNIKSPVIAMELLLPYLDNVPERMRKILMNSVCEIKSLANRLSKQPDELKCIHGPNLKAVNIVELVSSALLEKEALHSSTPDIKLSFKAEEGTQTVTVRCDPTELRAVISNMIDNAIESYEIGNRNVEIQLHDSDSEVGIEIKDYGKGLSDNLKSRIGKEEISEGKLTGQGVGLFHAYRTVSEYGGRIEISSVQPHGTRIELILPKHSYIGMKFSFKGPHETVIREQV